MARNSSRRLIIHFTEYADADGNLHPLGVSLQVQMEFDKDDSDDHPSFLAAANRLQEKSRRERPFLRPPPEAVTYFYESKIPVSYSRLMCYNCKNLAFDYKDDLHLHLRDYHDRLKYTFENEAEEHEVPKWRIFMKMRKSKESKQRKKGNEFALTIVAPSRPFDERAYLDEDKEDWQEEAMLSKQIYRRQFRLLPGMRKSYKVPKPLLEGRDDIKLYRDVTKRPLSAGEWVSESDDDDGEMEWLHEKERSILRSDPNIPEKAKAFLEKLNPFMRRLRLASNKYIPDAMLKFSEEHKSWIQGNEDIYEEFERKLDELVEDELIQQNHSDKCMAIVKKVALPTPTSLDDDVEMQDAPNGTQIDPAPASASPLPYEQCVCGEIIGTYNYTTESHIQCECDVSLYIFPIETYVNLIPELHKGKVSYRLHCPALEAQRETRPKKAQLDLQRLRDESRF